MSTISYSRIVACSVIFLALAAEVVLVPNVSQYPIFLGRYSARALLAIVGVALATVVVASAALKWPKVSQGLSLSAISVLVTVVVVECVARVVFQIYPTPYRFQNDPLLFHKWTPGYESVEQWYSLAPEYTMAISGQGLRNEVVEIPKQDGTFRVLALGDSVTEGPGVELEQTFVKLVERSLQSDFPKQRIEIINAGVGGYGIEQEYLWLREYGLRFQPDIVLLTVCLNDPSPFTPPTRIYSMLREAQDFLHRNSATYFYFSESTLEARMRAAIMHSKDLSWRSRWRDKLWVTDETSLTELIKMSAEQDGWGLAWNDSALSYLRSRLLDIVYLTRASDILLLLAITPVDVQVYAETYTPLDLEKPQQWLAEFAQTEQLPLVDVLPAFRAYRDQLLFYDHVHLSSSGHTIVAEELHDSFMRLMLAPIH